ncbi:MAG: hypothetical protein COU33_02785, partial [Candidatus Magasanikbacteria bacterium CG10_big_fil_rev_8_21_14_0_10_43_6]
MFFEHVRREILLRIFLSALVLCIFFYSVFRTPQVVEVPEAPYQLAYEELYVNATPSEQDVPTVVLLHGAGGDAKDLLFLFEEVRTPLRVISFTGPFSYAGGHAWLEQGSSEEVRQQYLVVGSSIVGAIQSLVPSVQKQPVALVGFSQGASLGYYLSLAYPEFFSISIPVAGSLDARVTPLSVSPGTSYPAVRALHGEHDAIIAIDEAEYSVKILHDFGLNATLKTFTTGHAITPLMREEIV